jgi:hypothetical protein
MRQRTLILALVIPAASVACAEIAQERVPLTGTYVIALCQGKCELEDSSRALFAGRLTLLDTPLVIAQLELPDAKREYLELTSAFMTVSGPLNGCFTFYPVRATRVDFHGFPYLRAPGASTSLEPIGLTHWEERGPDSISVTLKRSPDAGHDLLATITDGRLEGRGFWFAVGDGPEREREGDIGSDFVIGRRIGPPDLDSCIRNVPELPRRASRSSAPPPQN